MPKTFDDLLKAGVVFGGGGFAPAAPEKPKDRNLAAVANDTVIEAANAVAGWGKAAGDFIAPGNFVSQGIGRFIEEGEASQSDVAQAAKQTLRSDIEQADGIGGELAAVGRYVVRNPLLTAAQAVGSFVGPGAAIKGAQLAARGLGFGAKGVTRAGVAGGVAAGAAGGGGDAAGNAYELVMQTPLETLMQNPQAQALAQQGADEAQIRDALATEAARQASVVPALIGGAGGAFGAERLLAGGARTAGAKGFAKAVGSEALQEGVEEGATQFEAQRAAAAFNPEIEPTKGVAAAAGMGAVMGGVMGGGVQAITGDNIRATQTVPEVGVLSAAANAGTESRAQALDAAPQVGPRKVEPPPVDPVFERIRTLPEPIREEAMHAYAIINRKDVAKGVQSYNKKLLDKHLSTLDEAAAKKAGAQWQAMAPSEPADDLAAQQEAIRTQLEAEQAGGRASRETDARIEAVGRQWQDLGITDPGTDLQRQKSGMADDILTPAGSPFKSKVAAGRALKTAGEGYSVAEVPGGFAVRKDWREFLPESGTKAIPRAEMPQVEGQHHGALTNFLNARGVTHETVEVDPASLKPTQAEYSEAKVEQQAGSDSQRGILISSDGHVIDGHHKWLAAGSEGQPVKAIRLNAPVADLLPLIKEFPSAKTAEDQAPAAEQAAPEAAGDLPAVRADAQPAAVAGGGDGQAGADAAADAEPALTEKQEFKVGGRDPHTVMFEHRADGRLVRTITYPDGQTTTDTLVTDKKGDEHWVSNEQYGKREYYPRQLSEAEATAAIKDALDGKEVVTGAAPAAPTNAAEADAAEEAKSPAAAPGKPTAAAKPEAKGKAAPEPDKAPAAQKPFDPGELSIPNRTSTIDADLDRYKAEQAKAQRTEQKGNAIKRRADKARAKELFEQLWPAMKDRMGARFGEKELRSTLDSMVKWEPAKFVALAEKFQGESRESGPDQDAQFKREDQQEDQSLSEVEKILDKDTPPTKDDIAAIMRILDARRGGLSVEKAQEIVDSLTAKWKNGPVVRVVASARDLPIKAPSNVRGIYRPGEVWVVAGSHRDGKDVRRTIGRTLAHEAIAHYGLRDMLDADGWGDLMGKINGAIAAGNKPLTEIQAEVRRLYVDDKGTFNLRPEIEADEIAARVVEQAIDENGEFRPGFGFVKAVYAKIAEFLRSLGIDVTFTNAELQGMLVLAQRNLEVGKRTAGGGEVLVAAARDEEPDQALFARAAVLGAATAKLNETFNAPGKLSWWFKSFGTMYNLAERSPAFKPVFRAAHGFIDDVSLYASQAADLAPKILPKLEHWSDIGKSPISAADNKAIEAPINQGTLLWTRGIDGKPVKVADLEAKAAGMTAQQKAQELIRGGRLDPKVLRMWQGMEVDLYETTIGNKYEREMLRPGIVWNDAELKSMFGLTSEQIKLYREFRSATDKSLDNMAKAEMLRFAGEDGAGLRQAVMEEPDLDTAAGLLSDYLRGLAADQPDRADQLTTLASGMQDRADKVTALKAEGYAPLSRFGQYTVDVVVDGERQFFGLYESAREANRAAVALKGEFGAANVAQGTLSQQEFKLFAGITPESLEIFGNMLGLDSTGDEARDKAFQEYLQRTKSNRSAMKRLIHRKGIAGYSQDVGRVLAAFIYSNARQTSAALHMGDLTQSITDIPKTQGELKDAAIALADYIKNPQEEAQAIRGLLFAQYLGGSIASAFVNMTQPISVTFPWLSQFGGAAQSAAQIKRAFADLSKRDAALEPDLVRAMQKYEAVLEPQEIHHLMAQARGSATLKSGDGTKAGDLLARGGNALSKLAMGWGKVFGMAEQINRKSTFIAAYRIGVAQKMADPGAFAFKAVNETQFIYSKANKMRFGRGAVGGTVMTFKSFSVSYIELLHRMYTQGGPEGRRAVLLALAVLFLMGGAGGLPFAEDVEDLVDGALQRLGYNVSMKTAKREFLEGLFGPAGAQFVERGISGLPGVPIDVSGRLGLGNLIPGTGLFQQKTSYARDLGELAGPAGDFAKRIWGAKDQVMAGDIGKAVLQVVPVAVRNAAKGVDMADTGMYRDDKGYKVLDTTMLEAALKAIGFQPAAVAQVQESNMLNQRAKNFYSQTAADIRARWAKGIFEKDPDQIADARAMMERWNRNNPEQRITPNMPAILKRVREMRKTKEQRIADTAPKAMRQAMQRAAAEERARR